MIESSGIPVDIQYQMYKMQKRDAGERGIPFLLSFIEWIAIWDMSGKLRDRGRGKGKYVMARYGDNGPYSALNVEIITGEENISQAQKGRKQSQETIDKRRPGLRKPRKLSVEQILEIQRIFVPKKKFNRFGAKALARRYNVDPATIRNIVNRSTFAYQV